MNKLRFCVYLVEKPKLNKKKRYLIEAGGQHMVFARPLTHLRY